MCEIGAAAPIPERSYEERKEDHDRNVDRSERKPY